MNDIFFFFPYEIITWWQVNERGCNQDDEPNPFKAWHAGALLFSVRSERAGLSR